MDYIANLPRNLALVIAIVAILIIAYRMIVWYAERQPIYDPMTEGAPYQQEIAAQHVAKASAKIIKPSQFRSIGQLRDEELARRARVMGGEE